VDEVALEQVFSEFFGFPPLITIPPLLHTYLSPPHEVCDSPEQAAHYHTLGLKLEASSLTRLFILRTIKTLFGKNTGLLSV
jgi:hypothetical protein